MDIGKGIGAERGQRTNTKVHGIARITYHCLLPSQLNVIAIVLIATSIFILLVLHAIEPCTVTTKKIAVYRPARELIHIATRRIQHMKVDPTLAILIREFGGIPPQQHIESDAEAVEWMERYESDELHTLQTIAKEINEAAKQRETIGSDNTQTVYSFLGILADIRQKTGVGDKVMLGELAEVLGGLVQNGQSAIDTNKALVKKLAKAKKVLKESEEVMARCVALSNTRFSPSNSFIKEMIKLREKILDVL